MRWLLAVVGVSVVALTMPAPAHAQIKLTVRTLDSTTVFLDAPALPADVAAHALLATMPFTTAQPGLEWTELELSAGALRLPIRAVVVKLDPAAYELGLDLRTRANGMTGVWTVDSAAPDAAFAVNAGQFKETGPWGWLVLDGQEERDPGHGPLSVGIAIDSGGRVSWIGADSLGAARRDGSIRFAFQSYPALIRDGRIPSQLLEGDVDLDHRDARCILAELPSGELLFVLTRYDALGGVAGRVPIGLTVAESVALVTALGAHQAVMLDGGVSAQMLLRDTDGASRVWRGIRRVPLALVARPRH